MPTNLPPECAEIDARYRAATSPAEKIACLEELLGTIPKHKGTDHLRADLRRRLARLRDEPGGRRSAARQASAFRIEREGAGQVAVVGRPNVGKSALVAALTNATPEVAEYPFSTWVPTPGMTLVDNVQIQLIDTPPLDPTHLEPELIGLIRKADLILLMVDLQADPIGQLQDTLAMLATHHILPLSARAECLDPSRQTFKPMLFVANKTDDEAVDEDFRALCDLFEGECRFVPASAATGRGLGRLKQAIFDALGIIRVYTKPPGKGPDLTAPFVLKVGSTVGDLAGKIHKDFLDNLKSARVWGQGVFEGQLVGRDYVLCEGDIVELRA
ncbi:MAG: TGS domain-containing protein [Chloroflexi bacterium]|nr:TGS domain-containing protein [Chloroflexota bacterium]